MGPPDASVVAELTQLLQDRAVLRNLIANLILLLAIAALRMGATRFVRRTEWLTAPQRLRWRVQIRWISLSLLLLGTVVVWASELRTVALSVVAFAVALVIATKEIILCFLGFLVRTSSGSFRVGDRVEVGGQRGEVIDVRPLTTTLLEIGPTHQRTGRTLFLPNSVFLTVSVANETLTDDFVLHAVTVPLHPEADWQAARTILLEVAGAVCAPFLARARTEMEETARRHGLMPLTVDPQVVVRLPAQNELELVLSVPTPARARGATEQEILQAFLQRWRARG
jgi:small-conductance mechanosensitive channel